MEKKEPNSPLPPDTDWEALLAAEGMGAELKSDGVLTENPLELISSEAAIDAAEQHEAIARRAIGDRLYEQH